MISTVKRFAPIIIAALAIVGILFSNITQAISFGTPFGGRITSVIPCTCPTNFGWQITVGPPKPGVFMYKPGTSKLFSYFRIFSPGPWVLGTANGYSPCLQISGTGCAPGGSGGLIIRLVGTSKL